MLRAYLKKDLAFRFSMYKLYFYFFYHHACHVSLHDMTCIDSSSCSYHVFHLLQGVGYDVPLLPESSRHACNTTRSRDAIGSTCHGYASKPCRTSFGLPGPCRSARRPFRLHVCAAHKTFLRSACCSLGDCKCALLFLAFNHLQ